MVQLQKKISTHPMPAPFHADYHSVEFVLNGPHPIYQFKLWRTTGNGVFLLVKDNSVVLSLLKVGSIVPMKYMTGNAIGNTEVHDTQIKRIVNENQGRFQGHHRVELTIVAQNEVQAVH